MRWFLILAITALVLVLMGQSRSKQEAPAQHKDGETKAAPPTVSTPSTQPILSEQQNQTEQKPPKFPLPEWTDAFWSNWALVLITGGAVWYAKETLKDLKVQTSNAGKIAEAALLNAQAVINSERPWVLVTAERSEKIGNFLIKATIKGRTPARITEIYSHRVFVNLPDNLPPSPKYDSPVIAPKEPLLGDGESFKIVEVNPTFLVDEAWRAQHPNFAPYQFLCFYGIVRYEDCLATDAKKMHETRWCFSYFAEGDRDLHPVGPEEYCRKT